MQLHEAVTTREQRRRREAAAQHASKPAAGWPRLRQGDRFCFTGGLCDYAANSGECRGDWTRLRNGMWAFMDQDGRPHETHMPVDLQRYYGITTTGAAAIIADEEDGVNRRVIAANFATRESRHTPVETGSARPSRTEGSAQERTAE